MVLIQIIIQINTKKVIVLLEKYLINQCSPTLASLKTGSIFTINDAAYGRISAEIEHWNRMLRKKSLSLFLLKFKSNTALVYLCRKSQLGEDLSREGVAEFLHGYGYENTDVDYAISLLRQRLRESEEFPHEIGLFLGYPLGDVEGFIKNAGQNSLCRGCWKVYCNECDTMKLFCKFRKCREVYTRLFSEGTPVMKLTVA